MPTHEDFVRAIQVNPDDEAPWLMWSDYLVERGLDALARDVIVGMRSHQRYGQPPWWGRPEFEAETIVRMLLAAYCPNGQALAAAEWWRRAFTVPGIPPASRRSGTPRAE